MTWTPHPLTVGDGIIGAEENTAAEDEEQRRRAEQATDEMRAFSLDMYQRAQAAVARALGTKPRRP